MLIRSVLLALVLSLVLVGLALCDPPDIDEEEKAKIFMKNLQHNFSLQCNENIEARWEYTTDIKNEEAKNKMVSTRQAFERFRAEAAKNVSSFSFDDFKDANLRRQFRLQKDVGIAALNKSDADEYYKLRDDLISKITNLRIPPYQHSGKDTTKTLSIDNITDIFANTSTKFGELKYLWEKWHKSSVDNGTRSSFERLMKLQQKALKIDGYSNVMESWLYPYTVQDFETVEDTSLALTQDEFRKQIENAWNQIKKGVYEPLHAYVRYKLGDVYEDYVDETSPLPANVLGSLLADDWSNIYDLVRPYEAKYDFDVTQIMVDEEWTDETIQMTAQNFFLAMDSAPMTKKFWTNSVTNQSVWKTEILCSPEAFDFCLAGKSTDYRLRMCTDVTMEDFLAVHKKMAEIEYMMAYENQTYVYRAGANPGFVEAVSNAYQLSASYWAHLENIFGDIFPNDLSYNKNEKDKNFLMKLALKKLPRMAYSYVLDKYRWGVSDGSILPSSMNVEWWKLVESVQGLKVPSLHLRGNHHFDAAAHYHFLDDQPLISNFVSIVHEFQIYKALCPTDMKLHECDLSLVNNEKLRSAMALGLSQPWPKVLKTFGAQVRLDVDPLIEYFKPLTDFIKEELFISTYSWTSDIAEKATAAEQRLARMESEITLPVQNLVQANWNYNTDVNNETAIAQNNASLEFSRIYKDLWQGVINNDDLEYVSDPLTKRQYLMQKSIGVAILEPSDLSKFNGAIGNMIQHYGMKICAYGKTCDSEKDGYDIDKLEKLMGTQRSYDELSYYWSQWRAASGRGIIQDYQQYVELNNKAATLNGFKDAGSMWLNPYTSYGSERALTNSLYTETDFKDEVEDLWKELFPYYEMLHAYVRHKLKKHDQYKNYIYDDGLIPAHILGNMWAQSWENIYDIIAPYPEVPLLNITEDLQNMSVSKMFSIAEDFFAGMGLYRMTDDFNENSMFVQPKDRKVVCHASAWDFRTTGLTEANLYTKGKFRVKMCTDLNQEDFLTIHHEMGHTEYQMAYSMGKSLTFRDGANPGFHEAIGDTIQLSVSTPHHLVKIFRKDKLSKDKSDGEKLKINYLMQQALAKVAFLPFGYILDAYRWEIFNGSLKAEEYNRGWWAKRIDYQGLRPPKPRSPSEDFDAGSKYHVISDVPYIRYFISHILQFQFFERLCKEENPDFADDLYQCDFDKSESAGKLLKELLQQGATIQWQEQLAKFLGTPDKAKPMSAKALISYFDDLWTFIQKEMELDESIKPGWKKSDEVLGDYVKNVDSEISSVVPIAVGIVLVVLVAFVLVAYFYGRKKKRNENSNMKNVHTGQTNPAIQIEDSV